MVALNALQPQDLLRGCACAVIFTLFLSLDAWKAIERKAYWFPGRLLVLSAFTLQFINYANYTTVNVASRSEHLGSYPYSLVIDSGRVLIYVFVAYLLPGLVSSGFTSVWTDIGALTLTVLAHMLSELLMFGWRWFTDPYDCILFITNILLVMLCICAVLAGKTIRVIMNQKVPALLSCCSNSSCRDCGNIGDHVLKCWIVVRCSQLEYIMARSVLSSLAGVLVTTCFVQIVVEWKLFYDVVDKFVILNRVTFHIQFAFIFIGYIAVLIRWLSAVIYFPRYGPWRTFGQVEDFWTISLFELKYSELNGPFWEKIDCNRTLRHTLVISMGLFVQKFVVLLSKASLLLSWLLFWPLLMAREKIMLFFGSNITKSQFSKYREVLESIAMPGENAESLWIANESAFKSTKEHMEQGRGSTEYLIEIIRRLKGEVSVADEGEEEKYLKYFGKMSSKMRAVSLIHFMLCFYEDTNYEVVGDAFKACSEAWALMDFVESSDRGANLVSLAADKEFSSLKNIWKKNLKLKPSQSNEKLAIKKRMQKDIESRISKGESEERVNNMRDSMDWMTAAADMSLNKTSKMIKSKATDLPSANAIRDLGRLLAKVIVNCLAKELNNALIQKCHKWAVDGEEEKIYHAAFLAGKAMGVSDLFQTGQDKRAAPLAGVAEGEGND